YTMLVDMPLNSVPATTRVAALEAKREAARHKCRVDWAAWGGVVSDNQQDIEPLARAGVRGFKCFLIHPGTDDFTMVNERELRRALPHVARTGLPLLVHAELPAAVDRATSRLVGANWNLYDTYLRSRPEEAELSAIRLLIVLCREYRFHLHIVHLSASDGVALVRSARAEGLPVTVETCPHYLHLAAENIRNGATLAKCAPPVRSLENREKLWQGLAEGSIQLLATDHSPSPPEMKKIEEGDFRQAWGGIAGLSMALPVVWTEASRRGFTLSDVIRWMAVAPARLAGCDSRKGRIVPGHDADLVVFDPEAEFVVTKERLHQRHALSPYLGEKLRGVIKATYLRGQPVFIDGAFPGEPRGKEFRQQDAELNS
ncbi:MAG: allantoinase AllB, partial [Acidobacteria bacterium]|nr:allantoinase AllB [Acidobacteriota bacterium]